MHSFSPKMCALFFSLFSDTESADYNNQSSNDRISASFILPFTEMKAVNVMNEYKNTINQDFQKTKKETRCTHREMSPSYA